MIDALPFDPERPTTVVIHYTKGGTQRYVAFNTWATPSRAWEVLRTDMRSGDNYVVISGDERNVTVVPVDNVLCIEIKDRRPV